MEVNIYWGDLSEDGQNTLLENGFIPTEDQENEVIPIGVLDTEKTE